MSAAVARAEPALPRALVEAEGLTRSFAVAARLPWRAPRRLRAVADVSLRIGVGETLGVVGESGCGKSTLGRLLLGALAPDAGCVRLDGAPLAPPGGRAWRRQRREVQTIFQDPLGSLNPRLTVARQLGEVLRAHEAAAPARGDARIAAALGAVGLDAGHGARFAHELSGGQRQRVAIARALLLGPRFVVCDEPTAALDVSIQAQVINLLADLQARTGVSYLFISHDLSVVRHIAARVAVMYLGSVVETGPAAAVFAEPRHPYARALIAAAPRPTAGRRRRLLLPGEPPSPLDPPPGCAFHPRCAAAVPRCAVERPALRAGEGGRAVACHRVGEI